MKRLNILIFIVIALLIFVICDNALNYCMMRGVNNYYGLNKSSELLLIGHSHLMLATDKERLENETGMSVSKYCREGVNVTDRKAMVEHFLNSGYSDSLKYVLYGVDLCTFTGSGLSKNSYQLFYPFIDNEYIDEYLKSQTSQTDYWLHKLIKTTRFNNDGLKNSVWRGWCDNWDNYKTNTINIKTYRQNLLKHGERDIMMNDTLIHQFKETIDMLTERGVKVILVNTPTLDLLNNYQPDKYKRIMNWFTEYADKDSLVYFWDFNPLYSANHSIFSDRIHLNNRGQNLITQELINRLIHLKQQ